MAKIKIEKYYPIDSIKKCDLVLEKLKLAKTRTSFLLAVSQITEHIKSASIHVYFKSKADELKLKHSGARVKQLLDQNKNQKKAANKPNNKEKGVSKSLDLKTLLGKQIHEVGQLTYIKNKKLLNLIKKIDGEATLISEFSDKHLIAVKSHLLQSWKSNQHKPIEIPTESNTKLSPANFIGKELRELAMSYNKPVTELLYLLRQEDIEITADTILTENEVRVLKDFLEHAAKIEARHAKKESAVVRKIPKTKEQKSSSGQPGNYYKLIYNHPKQ